MGDVIPLRRFEKPSPARVAIDWEYVAKQLACSRSTAYEHLQRCAAEAGLPREGKALLRVDEAVWLDYYRRNFECGSTEEKASTTPRSTSTKRTAASGASARARAAPTKPQPKPSLVAGSGTPQIRPSRARGT